jgi:hypothetical protein
MVQRVHPVKRNGPADQIDGDVMAADLGGDHAEEMQGIGMIGLQRQRLAIERFGLCKPAPPVMCKAGGENTGNARVRWRRAGSLGGRLGGPALLAVHVLVPRENLAERRSPRPATHRSPARF